MYLHGTPAPGAEIRSTDGPGRVASQGALFLGQIPSQLCSHACLYG